MLGNQLTSDILKYIPRLSVVNDDYSDDNNTIFKLDWKSVDSYKVAEYHKWREKNWPEAKIVGNPATLPAQYEGMVHNMRYKIPHNYMTEIRHFTQLFVTESFRKRNFDTTIRDMCLKVRSSAINCAFNLLADCVVTSRGKWYREDNKFLIKHLLRYKFWRGYTGRGLVWFHAGFDQLADWSKPENARDRVNAKSCALACECITAINMFEEEEEIHWHFTKIKEKDRAEIFRSVDRGG